MVLLGAASLCAALEDGYYRIRSRPNSGACLDHYLYKGRRLLRIKSACSMADSQMFYLMKKPNGAFIVMTADFYPEEKTQCLAPLKDNNIDRDRHVYYFRDCGDSISQMFGDVQLQHYFVRESNGFYEIRNFAGDRSMDMGRDREWLKMHPRKNVDNQDWKVEAMYGSKNPLCNPGHYFDKTSLLCEPVRESDISTYIYFIYKVCSNICVLLGCQGTIQDDLLLSMQPLKNARTSFIRSRDQQAASRWPPALWGRTPPTLISQPVLPAATRRCQKMTDRGAIGVAQS